MCYRGLNSSTGGPQNTNIIRYKILKEGEKLLLCTRAVFPGKPWVSLSNFIHLFSMRQIDPDVLLPRKQRAVARREIFVISERRSRRGYCIWYYVPISSVCLLEARYPICCVHLHSGLSSSGGIETP